MTASIAFPVAVKTVVVNCPPRTLFSLWRNFEDVPSILSHIREIKVTSPIQMRWYAIAPVGTAVEWDAEIVREQTDKLIAWRSVPGSKLNQEGFVRFFPLDNGRATRLTVSLKYGTSVAGLSELLEKVFGADPGFELEHDLARLQERYGVRSF